MKIVIAAPIFPPEPGGPATYVQELCARLPEAHDVVVLTYADNPAPLTRGAFHVIKKNVPLLVRVWRFYRALAILAKDADVIYAQGAVAAGLPAALVARQLTKPLIVKFVGDEAWERARGAGATECTLPEFYQHPAPTRYSRLLKWVQKFVLQRADLVTTPSKYLGDLIVKGYRLKHDRVHTNYNATDVDTHTQANRVPHSIAVVNRLTPWKHVDEIIRAVALLKKEYGDITLTIAGDGPERARLEALTKELDLETLVSFRGSITKQEVNKILAHSSVYVLNSSYEGLPFTVLEAFAAHIPVVATHIPGTNELVSLDTGWPIPTHHELSVAQGVRDAFEHQSKCATKAESAHALLTQKFSWETHLKKLEEFFTTVTQKM